MSEIKYYHHGRFAMEGGTLPDAITAYRTYGDPSNPCIVFPTYFGSRLDTQAYMIGEDKALDPRKYYIVTFALFSNGESSSPSNTPAPYNGPYFPVVTYEDNVRAQYQVLTKELNISKIFCVIGFSMGGQQAYYWSVMYPDFVERFVPICSSAQTSPHNICFLEGMKSALIASKDFEDGYYTSPPQHGLRAFGLVGSTWLFGQTWYLSHGYLGNGRYRSLKDFMRGEAENSFLGTCDANDILTLLRTWQLGDISRIRTVSLSLQGDPAGVLGSITAKGLVISSKEDLFFPPKVSELEVAAMKNNGSKLVVIASDWGHIAGGPLNNDDIEFVNDQVRQFFESDL